MVHPTLQGHCLLTELPSWEEHPAHTKRIYFARILIFILGHAVMKEDSMDSYTPSTLYASTSQVHLAPCGSAFKTNRDVGITPQSAQNVQETCSLHDLKPRSYIVCNYFARSRRECRARLIRLTSYTLHGRYLGYDMRSMTSREALHSAVCTLKEIERSPEHVVLKRLSRPLL